MWPLLDFGHYCRFSILDVGRLLRVLDTNGRFFFNLIFFLFNFGH